MTSDEKPPNGLNAVLYYLNYVTDLTDDSVLPNHLIQQIKFKYKPEMVEMMAESIKWAIDNPRFNFEGQIPLNYNNDEIFLYLKKVDKQFEVEGIYSKLRDQQGQSY